MREKVSINRRRITRARGSLKQAQDIAMLSAPAAVNRLWDLRRASPMAVGAAMNRFAIEKAFAFSSAWCAASFAAYAAQLRWWRTGRPGNGADELESIMSKTLQPIATKVRKNSRLRARR